MSRVFMLKPADGIEGVKEAILTAVKDAGPNACPPMVVGVGIGGTFEKCAAENNQVKTMAYGGGFVGEVDDDYGVGKSTFTNCYTANCSVSSKTDDAQGVSLVGGFAGEMTDSLLTIQNCYVYQATLSTEGTAMPGIKATGVFAGQLWGGQYDWCYKLLLRSVRNNGKRRYSR